MEQTQHKHHLGVTLIGTDTSILIFKLRIDRPLSLEARQLSQRPLTQSQETKWVMMLAVLQSCKRMMKILFSQIRQYRRQSTVLSTKSTRYLQVYFKISWSMNQRSIKIDPSLIKIRVSRAHRLRNEHILVVVWQPTLSQVLLNKRLIKRTSRPYCKSIRVE